MAGETDGRSGKEKELLAAEWMKGHGYEILEMNYRCRQGEVDIVAKDGAYLVFVEVKYRRDRRGRVIRRRRWMRANSGGFLMPPGTI